MNRIEISLTNGNRYSVRTDCQTMDDVIKVLFGRRSDEINATFSVWQLDDEGNGDFYKPYDHVLIRGNQVASVEFQKNTIRP